MAAGTKSRSGSKVAEAAPKAARRANSRRETGLSVGGMAVTSEREGLGQSEATESGARGQPGFGDSGERGKEVLAQRRGARRDEFRKRRSSSADIWAEVGVPRGIL